MPRNIALMMLCAFGLMVPAQVFAGPRILCREPLYDFGEADNSEPIEHEFILENTGDEPLKFGRTKGCCGLSIDFKAVELPPGSNVSCRVAFNLSGREGPQRKSAFVASNDPRLPYYELTLKGTARASVQIRPPILLLGNVSSQAPLEKKISISMAPGHAFSITNVVSSRKDITCTYQSVPKGWDVTVRFLPPLPPGVLRGAIRIETDRPKKPYIDIPYSGMVDVPVICSPSEISIIAPDTGSKPQDLMPFYLLIRATDGKPFKVENVEVPTERIRATVEPLRAGLSRIRFDGLSSDSALDNEEIVILLNHPKTQELHIPINVIPPP